MTFLKKNSATLEGEEPPTLGPIRKFQVGRQLLARTPLNSTEIEFPSLYPILSPKFF